MGESEKKTQRMGWMIERLLASTPGAFVRIDYGGERRDGSLYQATLIAPSGSTSAPCGPNAFEAVSRLHSQMVATGHQHAKAAREYLAALGWEEPTELVLDSK
jgi:hypothetical protein